MHPTWNTSNYEVHASKKTNNFDKKNPRKKVMPIKTHGIQPIIEVRSEFNSKNYSKKKR